MSELQQYLSSNDDDVDELETEEVRKATEEVYK